MKAFYLFSALFVIHFISAQEQIQSLKQLKVSELTQEYVKEQLKTIETKEFPDEKKKKIQETYQEILETLKSIAKWEEKSKEFSSAIVNASARLKTIKQSLNQNEEESEAKINILVRDASLTKLEQTLVQIEVELTSANKEVLDLQEVFKHRSQRRTEIPIAIDNSKKKLAEIAPKLTTLLASTETFELVKAQYMLELLNQKNFEQELESYEKEILSYDTRNELLTARKDLATKKVNDTEKRLKKWREIVNNRRQEEANKVAQKARKEQEAAAQSHPLIKKIAEENAQLTQLRVGPNGLTKKLEQISNTYEGLGHKLSFIQEDFKKIQERAQISGMTYVIGMLLRKKNNELPNIKEHQKNIGKRQIEITNIQLKVMELEEQKVLLSNIEQYAEKILAPIKKQKEQQNLRKYAKELLQTKRNYVELLLKDYHNYFIKLVDVSTKEQLLIGEAATYKNYIAENIFWVRSAGAFQYTNFTSLYRGLLWFIDFHNWKSLVGLIYEDIFDSLIAFIFFILLSILSLWFKRKLLLRVKKISETISSIKLDHFYALKTLVLTFIAALIWPLIVYIIGWRIYQISLDFEFGKTIAVGIMTIFPIHLSLSFISLICIDKGLAKVHFRWNSDTVDIVYKNLQWLLRITLPLVFVVATIENQVNDFWKDSFGRFVFVAGIIVLICFFYTIFRPSSKLVQQNPIFAKTRYLWMFFSIGSCLLLGMLAIIGYYYTALQLTQKLWYSFLLFFITGIIYFTSLHWLLFIRRKFKMRKLIAAVKASKIDSSNSRFGKKKDKVEEQNKEETKEQNGKKEPKSSQEEQKIKTPEEPPKPLQESPVQPAQNAEEIDISTLILQLRKFLKTFSFLMIIVGLWFIWSDVFPALKVIKRIELWSTAHKEVKTIQKQDGTTAEVVIDKKTPVTLGSLIYAVLVAIITLVISKNLPAILEAILLQRLKFDKGVSFAIHTLSKYLIVLIGFIMVFYAIGLNWSKVQWLAAAFTVGLGFGLQEIFANFISGLIILFERPMRVGDTVTIGETSGTVTKIRIRATTIQDWDCKELIVPNKEFITGRLINWSLSDNTLRVVVPVGIAYGSNTKLAHELLLKIAQEHSDILKTPAPLVIFLGFGDSSLNFSLRVYIAGIEFYTKTLNELHMKINEEFRNAKIEIAFPQRDIHIRSFPKELLQAPKDA